MVDMSVLNLSYYENVHLHLSQFMCKTSEKTKKYQIRAQSTMSLHVLEGKCPKRQKNSEIRGTATKVLKRFKRGIYAKNVIYLIPKHADCCIHYSFRYTK